MKRLEKTNWQKKSEKRKSLRIVLLCVFLLVPLGAGLGFVIKNFASRSNIVVTGSTIYVKSGGDFQAALNRAKAGDTIVLQSGAKFVGSFTLPVKAGSEFITIQSSELAKLPADGVRVGPKDAVFMPKILSSGKGESAVKTAPGAHHYRFVGIEFAPSNADYIYNLVALGSDTQTEPEIPHHIEIDRCYLHQNSQGVTRRGIALNSAETDIKNSYLSGFAGKEQETQAIAGWNGSGKYKIINNYLEAGAENVLFGGSDPSIKNLVPTDIEIRNNLMTKPLEWRGKVTIKCTFELKNARNVRVVGNIIENSFDEIAVRITVRNQDGSAPWSTIEDVVMQNNIIRNSGGGINFLGTDDNNKSAVMKRVEVTNNLFTGIDADKFGADGRFILISDGEDINVSNNTVFASGNAITAHGAATRRFTFRGNIFSFNNYGFSGDNGVGRGVFSKYFADGLISDNVIVNSKRIPKSDIYIPPRNYSADDFGAVGFLNWQSGNYRLSPNSKYKNKGSNGKDLGADIDQIETETKKAE
ncbi:MAG TPA: hypothetical protein VGC76_05925 [Pyrinomonadaceae bacterium]|jgi:hypothetical protein